MAVSSEYFKKHTMTGDELSEAVFVHGTKEKHRADDDSRERQAVICIHI